ncbi:GIY-YIG nuclease family protein [Bacillus subtilis]|uniref:GIY-YIG nuclease family protein n=1 Tax=Bacillus subtilis TaxID=1423 RepID=UPI00100A20A4|nr:GIY-YIG nuclease family protein [Bacillus subtilis]QAV85177.1 hypothetical protein ES965_14275 [Bacillus subtilis]WEZ21243.1 GIY-YIG nuclease family protein [Bacillus subtilis]WJD91284.1 GIY-YIG nuclease family protein [Bacillus spizizenii]
MINISLPSDYIQDNPIKIRSGHKYSYGGVYVFFNDNDEALYVGKTNNFRKRFNSHCYDNRFFKESTYARLYEIKDEFERDIYETHAIRHFNPKYNKAKVYHRHDEIEFELSVLEAEIEEMAAMIKELRDELNSPYYDYFDEEEYNPIEELGRVLFTIRQIDELKAELAKMRRRKLTLTNRRHL